MVVVTIELWPNGSAERKRLLGVAKIANDGTGTPEAGNYDVLLSHSGQYIGRPGTYRQGKVKNHSRRLSAYHLVLAALLSALGR